MQRLLLLFAVLFFQMAPAQQPVFVKKWDKRYGGTDSELLFSFIQTSEGGYILGGESLSGVGGDKTEPSQGGSDFWIIKIDSLGNKEWDKSFGGSGTDGGFFILSQTLDSGFILGGYSSSQVSGDKTEPSRGGGDFWIVKTDLFGNKEWDKTFGGSSSENLVALVVTRKGNFLLGGDSNSGISGDKTQENWDSTHFYDDGWVVMVNSMGDKIWDRRFGGTNEDGVSSIVETEDSGFLLACYAASDSSGDKTSHNQGISDLWLVKIDSLGNKIWDKNYGGLSTEYPSTIIRCFHNGYLAAVGSISGVGGDKTQPGSQWMVRIDSLGDLLWEKSFNGGRLEININSVCQTADGGFLMATEIGNSGSDKSEPNMGPTQTWILKTDSSGNKQWDKTIFSPNGQLFGKAIQANDGCYVVATYAIKTGGYVSELNRDSSDSTRDYWILKFCWEIPDNAPLLDSESGVSVYPNPFTSDLSIFLQKANLKEATFTITNIMGQMVFHKEENNLAPSYAKMLDLSYLPHGVYLVEVVIDGERTVRKVVKE